MSRFTTGSELYQRTELREDEFESLVPRFLLGGIDSWTWGPWKQMLDSPYGRTKADAVLVANDLSRWCVVEVELVSHPETHFRSQFERISSAHYGSHLAPSIATAIKQAETHELRQMLREESPEMLCIANGGSDSLATACRDFGFKLATGLPFRSDRGNWAINWTRYPSLLENRTGTPEHLLTILEEKWGGRHVVELPHSFPQTESITLRVADLQYQAPVRLISDRRRIILPVGVGSRRDRPLLLRMIDPFSRTFELVNGVLDQ